MKNTSLELVGTETRAYHADTEISRVVLADNDVRFAGVLKQHLERDRFAITLVHDGRAAVQHALSGKHDVVVLEAGMPGMDGFDALREIRSVSQVPVLMITSGDDDVNRIFGLGLWADDYVPKTRTASELAMRLCRILRRMQIQSGPLKVGPIVLWPGKRKAECQGRALDLTSAEFNILHVLAAGAGYVVSKKDLSEKALARPLARYDRSIDVHLSNIRQKLGVFAELIHTVRGQGYQLASG
jgi:two-component system OmpR family response regulator/two-component system response regulator CpxR